MTNKKAIFQATGMVKDISSAKFNKENAFDIRNMRIINNGENTGLSLTNERGNLETSVILEGTPIGQAVINDKLVLFLAKTTDDEAQVEVEDIYRDDVTAEEYEISDINFIGNDQIHLIEMADNRYVSDTKLFSGKLGFDTLHPIETLSVYEAEGIEKVYWTDALNQPRVINIDTDAEDRLLWNKNSFDFTPELALKETVTIVRNTLASGIFAPGTIQYCFTYFNPYGPESNIFYTTPLYYISYPDRGAAADETVSNSFNITITNPDINFKYVRIYSVHRTSYNATPLVKRVADCAVTIDGDTPNDIFFIDNGTTGEIIDPTQLLFIGGEEIVAESIAQKDNKLFLGNIKLTRNNIDDEKKSDIKDILEDNLSYKVDDNRKYARPELSKGHYIYDNLLDKNSSEIKTFKYLDYYRFGVQLQYKNGKWSSPIFVADLQNHKHPVTDGNYIELPYAESSLSDGNLISSLVNEGYKRIRPIVVYPTIEDREVICQGIVNPTVFNVRNRNENIPYSQASWYFRPNSPISPEASLQPVPAPANTYTFNINIDNFIENHLQTSLPTVPSEDDSYIIKCGQVQHTISSGNVRITQRYNIDGILWPETFIITADESIDTSTITALDVQGGYLVYTVGTSVPDIESIENTTVIPDPSKDTVEEVVNNNNSNSSATGTINLGKWLEYRHYNPIPDNYKNNAEIQSIYRPPLMNASDITSQYATEFANFYRDAGVDKNTWVSVNQEYYYVDRSIFTLNSPEIDFDDEVKSIDYSNIKFRIVGRIPLTASVSNVDIQTENSGNLFNIVTTESEATTTKYQVYTPGFYSEPIGSLNRSMHGWRAIGTNSFWIDDVLRKKDASSDTTSVMGFAVYPWHRNGSLNNSRNAKDIDGTDVTDVKATAVLKRKVESTLRFSDSTEYFSADESDTRHIWKPSHGVSGISIFNLDTVSLVKLPSQKEDGRDISYYGNIDTVVPPPTQGCWIEGSGSSKTIYYKSNGYPICVGGVDINNKNQYNAHALYDKDLSLLRNNNVDSLTNFTTGNDPVSIKYKSTPHAVCALNYFDNNGVTTQELLPTISYNNSRVDSVSPIADNSRLLFWEDTKNETRAYNEDSLFNTSGTSEMFGYLWLGEFYRDDIDIPNRFGGNSPEAIESNLWLPCGEPVDLTDSSGASKSSVTIKWLEGDTYYQRYDCLKTYPFTNDDTNSIVDIVSCMCETRVNIDGRYDRNRGQGNNLNMSPVNFNLINKAYSSSNNFFNYRTVSSNKIVPDVYPNTITWTLTKTMGEFTDSWTNVTLASVLDLNGDKGEINAVRLFNNELYAFQDLSVARILYNENITISSDNGLPIEIANSDSVRGYRYINDSIGCKNKWSICITPAGLYFVDSFGKDIYTFNGESFRNITSEYGMHSWINVNISGIKAWNPVTFDECISYYDKVFKDIYFITSKECLAFSEFINKFTSFYSYESTPNMATLKDTTFAVHKGNSSNFFRLWKQNLGPYNTFFGRFQPYSITYLANADDDVIEDKTFNNIEFLTDKYDSNNSLLNTTFDTVKVWNEYQENIKSLTFLKDRPSILKKKFRRWRLIIPRDGTYHRDRIRNHWAFFKLSTEEPNTDRFILHDTIVDYFI